mmetsp:Transcript_119862/g.382629  ORF Transcript_119862/g.382629 Transcript_119862/m.382629 type:complete len:302 (+) Transcript_119862:324-1229(+)
MELLRSNPLAARSLCLTKDALGQLGPAEEEAQGGFHHTIELELFRLGLAVEARPRAEVHAPASISRFLQLHIAVILRHKTTETLEVHLPLQQHLQILTLLLCANQHTRGNDLLSGVRRVAEGARDRIHVRPPDEPGLPPLLPHDLGLDGLNVRLQLTERGLHRRGFVCIRPLLHLPAPLAEAQRLQGLRRVAGVHGGRAEDKRPRSTAKRILQEHRELRVLVRHVRQRSQGCTLIEHLLTRVKGVDDRLQCKQALIDLLRLLEALPVTVVLSPTHPVDLFSTDHQDRCHQACVCLTLGNFL